MLTTESKGVRFPGGSGVALLAFGEDDDRRMLKLDLDKAGVEFEGFARWERREETTTDGKRMRIAREDMFSIQKFE